MYALTLGCDGECERIEQKDSFLGGCTTIWSDCPDDSGYSDYKTICRKKTFEPGEQDCTCEIDEGREVGTGFSLGAGECAGASEANAGCGWSLPE
ncbi:MAG TPA: hypothetical protein VFB62_13105 [Polyangiaceae bacterium]|nr:hypothetical protein [Polyangiaceae bacterium]